MGKICHPRWLLKLFLTIISVRNAFGCWWQQQQSLECLFFFFNEDLIFLHFWEFRDRQHLMLFQSPNKIRHGHSIAVVATWLLKHRLSWPRSRKGKSGRDRDSTYIRKTKTLQKLGRGLLLKLLWPELYQILTASLREVREMKLENGGWIRGILINTVLSISFYF